jgi:hypothetical protein
MSSLAAADAAIAATARQKVKQALAACRTAAQRLAQIQDLDVYGTQHVTSDTDAQRAVELIALARSEHEHVDVVVVIASPNQ